MVVLLRSPVPSRSRLAVPISMLWCVLCSSSSSSSSSGSSSGSSGGSSFTTAINPPPLECDGNSSSNVAALFAGGSWSPLLLAAAWRHPQCFDALLSTGDAAVSLALQHEQSGKNALHLSAELGSAAQLSTLVKHVGCNRYASMHRTESSLES
jgi:hypothetical protein